MADFLDAEAEESSESEQESNHVGKKARKRAKRMEESELEEEDEEDEEAKLQEELKDLINDESSEESEPEGSKHSDTSKKRKKSQSADFDDGLEDDDYELLEENLGITVQRKKRFKRLRRMEEHDSDEEREREPEEERDAIANQLFDGSEDEEERRSVISHRPEAENLLTEAESGAELSDADDFIVDDDGRPVADKRRQRRTYLGDSALQEAQEIFGVDFDYEEFDKYGEEADVDEDEDDEYVDDDLVEGERSQPVPKKSSKRKSTRKSIFEVYEPSELKRGHFTDIDNEIRNTDIPERMQLRSIPITPVPEGSEELSLEADWIHKYAFNRPSISVQDAHLSAEAKERARKGPQAIGKIKKALDFMRNQNFEVPFISFYRKEYVNPDLNINDLWKIYRWDAKWCELSERKNNLVALFEKMRSYQLDEIMKMPDAPLPDGIRVIKEEDIDRLRSVETSEELNDVHHHFMLYYSHEIPKMQAEIRRKWGEARRAAKLAAARQRRIEAGELSNDEEDENEIDVAVSLENESDDFLKQASRTGPYAICRRAGFEAFAQKFGLTPERYGEHLRDNYQRHEIEQDPTEPSTMAIDYTGEKFKTVDDVLEAVRLMVAIQLAREPLVRKCIREIYMERANITVRPTKKGIKEIDENHPIFSMKYLKEKPVKQLVGDEYLKLVNAETDKLVTISLSDTVEGTMGSDSLLAEMKQLYHRDEFSKNVQEWNTLRAESVRIAYERMLIPDFKKELQANLMTEAKEFVVRSAARKMYNWIKVAPYTCSLKKVRAKPVPEPGAEEEECWDDPDETDKAANEEEHRFEDDDEWKMDKGLRVMGLAYVPDYSQVAFACIISREGECTDYLRLPHLIKRKNSPREEERTMKEADLLAVRNFIEMKKPHVIAIGGESREATMLRDDLNECIATLVQETQFPEISVEICENELAKIYGNSNRGVQEFKDYPVILRQAISVARRLQDPLVEFSQLCGLDDEILCLKYHAYEDQVPKEELLENIQQEFVNRVNEVGVDLNRALQYENAANLVQFVCGLGSRKAHALLKLLKQTNKRIENRTQLVTVAHMGPKVFINCAGFIKIDTASLGDSTDTYVEVLDSTRVHPETYEWARKMAVDALEYDDEDDDEEANPADALHEIFESPERLKDLDLDAFAEELERQGFGNKSVTLYDIRAELNSRYKDLRAAYEPPGPEKLFNILTKETPESFYIGKLVLATVSSMNRRKPEGEQLDQANPVRNDKSGLWQCPFCLKNDFPELSEVWNHFDAGSCPGRAIGVRLRLDNAVSGYIHVKNVSDKHVDNPEDRVRPGQVIHCRVIKIDVERFSVECSSKSSDLLDKNNEWRPQCDAYYDTDAEELDLRTEVEAKINKKRQAYIKRVIVHTAFHNVSYAEAAKMLEPMKQGEAIVRPSSKGTDRLTITWKVTEDVLHHIDVREDEKKFAFSLGKRLFIDKEEFEDLDEILARHVNPMAAYASELLECHYYKPVVDGIEEKANEIMKEQKQANPARIPCILSASKKYPGKFLLSYMPRERCVHEYISVSPNGVRYRGRTFPRVGELFNWFRKHFRDPRPVSEPKPTPFYTPGALPERAHGTNDDEDWDNPTLSMTSDETPNYLTCQTPGTMAGSQYGGTSTPYTPSAKTPWMTPAQSSGYGNTTPGKKDGEFLHPGVPPSVAGWGRRISTPGRNQSIGDFYNWKRSSSGAGYSDENSQGRGGRGRGRGRGRGGRGHGGNSNFNNSFNNYSNSGADGGTTPLWDEPDNGDTSGSAKNSSFNGGSSANGPAVGTDTPLWDASESWDNDNAGVVVALPASKQRNDTQNSSSGNRTPLWDASESWDDPDESAPQPAVPFAPSAPRGDSHPESIASTAPSIRSSVWNASESWDEPEAGRNAPQRPKPNRPQNNSYSQSSARGRGGSTFVAGGRSNGSRTPLYTPEESWDDEEPAVATPRIITPTQPRSNSYSRGSTRTDARPNVGSSACAVGSRTPLYTPEESWDDDEPAVATPRIITPTQSRNNSYSGASTRTDVGPNVGSNAHPVGSRTPLYAPEESWDDEEAAVPTPRIITPTQSRTNSYSGASTRKDVRPNMGSSAGPVGSRTPLYAPEESWDNEEPKATTPRIIIPTRYQKDSSRSSESNNFSNNSKPPSSIGSIGSRTPLYAPEESWDDDEQAQPQKAMSPKSSYELPPTNVISRSEIRPAGSRTPVHSPYQSWSECNSSVRSLSPTSSVGSHASRNSWSRGGREADRGGWGGYRRGRGGDCGGRGGRGRDRGGRGGDRGGRGGNRGGRGGDRGGRGGRDERDGRGGARRGHVYAPLPTYDRPDRSFNSKPRDEPIPQTPASPPKIGANRSPLYDESESWD